MGRTTHRQNGWEMRVAKSRILNPRITDSPTPRRPASPHPRRPDPRPSTDGFTLIELLVVISIMVLLLGLTATMIRPDREGRRVREAARSVNVYLSSARNLAMETGRPCGVTFRSFNSTAAAMDADQCEVPPSYAGETIGSMAVVVNNGTTIQATLTDGSGNYESIPYGMVKEDDLIQLNLQGPLYTIENDPSDGSTYTLTLTTDTNVQTPWSTTQRSVPYRIFRSPIKGFAQPLQLPAPAVVDLGASGIGAVFAGANDFTIMFSPNGTVDYIYRGSTRAIPVGTIYLLIGSNARVANGYVHNNTNVDTLTNYQDLNNLWVTVNTQTGAIQTEPVAAITPTKFAEGQAMGLTDEQAAIRAAQSLAAEGVGMGGR